MFFSRLVLIQEKLRFKQSGQKENMSLMTIYFFVFDLYRQNDILIFEKWLDVFVIVLITQ